MELNDEEELPIIINHKTMDINEFFGIIDNFVPKINLKMMSKKSFTNIRLTGTFNWK